MKILFCCGLGVDAENHIQHVFICPGYMETILQHVCISLDASHLWSSYKGTICIYSGLRGCNVVYMYLFSILMGNEDYATWTLFDKPFSHSCPSVSHVEEGQKHSKFVFISDWDKGLEQSLWEMFLKTWQKVVFITLNKMFL